MGGIFVTLQFLSDSGYTSMNYTKLQAKLEELLGIGSIESHSNSNTNSNPVFQQKAEKVQQIVGYNMPSGGGFTAGLVLGLRS